MVFDALLDRAVCDKARFLRTLRRKLKWTKKTCLATVMVLVCGLAAPAAVTVQLAMRMPSAFTVSKHQHASDCVVRAMSFSHTPL